MRLKLVLPPGADILKAFLGSMDLEVVNRSGVLREINSETLRLKKARDQTRRRSLDFVLAEPSKIIVTIKLAGTVFIIIKL